MEINLTTVVLTILNAILLYIYLKKYLFVPVTKFMSDRTNSIQNQIKDADSRLEESEKLRMEYESKIERSVYEGKGIVEDFKTKAMSISDEMIDEAKREAERIRERARIDAEREVERVRDEMRQQIVTLSLLAASKSIEEQINEEKHHALIKEFINKVGV